MPLPLLIPIVSELIRELTKDEKDEKTKSKIKEAIVYEAASAAVESATKDNRKFWQSKRWYMTLIAVLVPIANRFLGWELSEVEIATIAGPIVAYVLGKSFEQRNS